MQTFIVNATSRRGFDDHHFHASFPHIFVISAAATTIVDFISIAKLKRGEEEIKIALKINEFYQDMEIARNYNFPQ